MLRVLPSTFKPENRFVAGCEKMVQKVASSSTFFATKSVHVARFTSSRQTSVLEQVT